MRTSRAHTDLNAKHFHIESNIAADIASISHKEAHDYHALVESIAVIFGYSLPFFAIQPRGIHLLVKVRPKKSNADSSEMAQAFDHIGEHAIAAALKANDLDLLDNTSHQRYLQYESNHQNIQRFIQTTKQRIARKYNLQRSRIGTIWADRSKYFALRNRANDFLDVAGYIMLQCKVSTQQQKAAGLTSLELLRQGDTQVSDTLNQLLKTDLPPSALCALLEEAQGRVDKQMQAELAAPRTGKEKRGRQAKWRPHCERPKPSSANEASVEYLTVRKRARYRFLKMLKRYEQFQKRTGLDRIPCGYQEDQELRVWARELRGKYKQGRLPQWQIDKLQGSALLEPAIPRREWKPQAK